VYYVKLMAIVDGVDNLREMPLNFVLLESALILALQLDVVVPEDLAGI